MKLLRHLAGYLPVNLASGLAAFGGVYVFTRLLTPEEYGRYALMLSLMAIIHTLSLTAAEAAAFRFAGKAEHEGRLPNHFASILSLTKRSFLISLLLLLIACFLLRHQSAYWPLLACIGLLLPVSTIIQIGLESHRAMQSVRRYVVTETCRLSGGFGLGALIAWQSGFGAASPLIGMLVIGLVLAMREGLWLKRQARTGTPNRQTRRHYLTYGLPIAAALSLDIILSAADRFLIAWFMGEAAVGAYTAGYGVADKTVLLICAWAAMAGAPLMMDAFERHGPEAAVKEARGLIRTLLLLGVPAATGLALVAQPLADILIGEALRAGAVEIIPWIAFAGLLNGLNLHYAASVFHLTHQTRQLALMMLIPSLTNIGLNLLLIPGFGLMGAVAATVISYSLGLVVLLLAGRRVLALPLPVSDLVRIAIAAFAMWPVIQIIPDWGGWPELSAKAIAGALVYSGLALWLDAGDARRFVRQKMQSAHPSDT